MNRATFANAFPLIDLFGEYFRWLRELQQKPRFIELSLTGFMHLQSTFAIQHLFAMNNTVLFENIYSPLLPIPVHPEWFMLLTVQLVFVDRFPAQVVVHGSLLLDIFLLLALTIIYWRDVACSFEQKAYSCRGQRTLQ